MKIIVFILCVSIFLVIAISFVYYEWLLIEHGRSHITNVLIVSKISLVVGGIAGFLIALWRAYCHDKQARIAENGYNTDRFIKITDQFGSDYVSVKLGAIYSLWNIYVTSSNIYEKKTILDMLSAFIRSNIYNKNDIDSSNIINNQKSPEDQNIDIISAINILVYNLNKFTIPTNYIVRLDGIYLSKREFNNNITYYIRFDNSNLVYIKFFEGNFFNCQFLAVNFINCFMNENKFHECKFTRAIFLSQLKSNYFECCNFEYSNFSGKLEFCTIDNSNAKQSFFIKTILINCYFDNSNFIGSNFESSIIKSCTFKSIDLSHAEFSNSHISDSTFKDINLSGINFNNANIINTTFLNCYIKINNEYKIIETNKNYNVFTNAHLQDIKILNKF